ncbi:hypothetical protein BDQ17DRAFT_1372359 [Cyathus striatus]|nr:hypothetical protein BDQ17DRAFT_1372359 [Cyathus striatus]
MNGDNNQYPDNSSSRPSMGNNLTGVTIPGGEYNCVGGNVINVHGGGIGDAMKLAENARAITEEYGQTVHARRLQNVGGAIIDYRPSNDQGSQADAYGVQYGRPESQAVPPPAAAYSARVYNNSQIDHLNIRSVDNAAMGRFTITSTTQLGLFEGALDTQRNFGREYTAVHMEGVTRDHEDMGEVRNVAGVYSSKPL